MDWRSLNQSARQWGPDRREHRQDNIPEKSLQESGENFDLC